MKAFWIPEDSNKYPEFIEIPGDGYEAYRALFSQHGIQWLEQVNTQVGHDNGFVTVVDDNSGDGTHYLNQRATDLSGYPGPLCGDVIFVSQAWVDDGIDIVTLSPKAEAFFAGYLTEVLGH